ncbi:MAG: DUF2116 family Zn-ribbon domain-containing protein [Candidatus Hodarchaeota archaeon]
MSSSRKKYTPATKERFVPHRHCMVCNKIVPEFSDGYCSHRCRMYGTQKNRGGKKRLIRLISSVGIIGAFVIILLLLSP